MLGFHEFNIWASNISSVELFRTRWYDATREHILRLCLLNYSQSINQSILAYWRMWVCGSPQGWNCLGAVGSTPQFMPTDTHFWVKIGF